MPPTKIPYADYSFSPWQGCEKVSPGCKHCFAEAVDERFYGGGGWGPNQPRKMQSETYWEQPLYWNERAKARGVRRRVLCGTMCDVLMASPYQDVADARARLWTLIQETPHLDWMILSKRAENLEMIPLEHRNMRNVWVGVTVEDQKRAEERMPRLTSFDARVRWVSAEPLLEPIELGPWLHAIDWVVVGAESGTGRRKMLLDWVRDLKAQCRESKTAFFFKQCYEQGNNRKIDTPELDGVRYVEMPSCQKNSTD